MSKYRVTLGGELFGVVEIGQPEDQIRLDRFAIGRKYADGSCRTDDCIRIAVDFVCGPASKEAKQIEWELIPPKVRPESKRPVGWKELKDAVAKLDDPPPTSKR